MPAILDVSILRIFIALIFVSPLFAQIALAADPNGYTAQYECRAGNPNCDVDVVALGNRDCLGSQSQIITASMPWSSIDWSKDTICIEAGDHLAKGALVIPASANGSASNYKVLRYFRSTDNDDDPWQQSAINQARLERILIEGDYWLIHRLSFPAVSGVPDRIQYFATIANDVRDIIINRVLIEGNGAGSSFYGVSTGDYSQDYQGLSIQNSVMRNVGPVAPQWESIAVSLHVADDQRNSRFFIVNNEIYDWVSHPIQIGRNELPIIPGIVIENNDLYVTPSLYTPAGRAKTEGVLSIKAGGTAAHPIRIVHNRLWGTRPTDTDFCCNGDSGQAVGAYVPNAFVFYRDNIVYDSQIGIDNVANDNSLVGNIFFEIAQYYVSPSYGSYAWRTWWHPQHGIGDRYEAYLNTIILATGNSIGMNDGSAIDTRCNVFVDSGSATVEPSAGGAQADDNVFYGAPKFTLNGVDNNIELLISNRADSTQYNAGQIVRTASAAACDGGSNPACFLYRVIQAGTSAATMPVYCTALGCTVTDGSVTLQAIRGPYVFFRKLRTNPEQYVIPYATVHTSADEANFCPPTFANRTGIGINNDVAWNGIFAQDRKGASRSGTAGALQATGGNGGGGGGVQSPFGGTPWPVPGLIETENFDDGGEGVAYHDTTSTNEGGAYRSTAVDLEASAENGYNIGWTQAGEWVEYSVNVTNGGTYTLELRVASAGQGGALHLDVDGVNVTGAITVPDTGGWQNWQTLTKTGISLTAGAHILRLAFDAVGTTGNIGNVNYLRFTQESGGTGTILREYWTGIPGGFVTDLTNSSNYPNNPSGSDQLNVLEAPIDWADNYGTRIRGYVHPPVSGSYVFWIASDDYSELWVSSDANPANKVRVASVSGWTASREWNKYPSQQSAAIALTAGQRYYIEVLQKEGTGGDNVAVAWQLPDGTLEGPIPGNRLSPYATGSGNATGTVLRHYWTGIAGDFVTDLTSQPSYPHNPTASDQVVSFEAPTDWADNYGTRVQGFVHPPATGAYTFWIASDDYSELWLSTDHNAANKARIAMVNGWTAAREWNKYPSQQSAAITLQAGQRYYIEALQKEGTGGDNLAVGWRLPDGTFEGPIPGGRLSPGNF